MAAPSPSPALQSPTPSHFEPAWQAEIDACYAAAAEDEAKLAVCDARANAITALLPRSEPRPIAEPTAAPTGPMDPDDPAARAEFAACGRQPLKPTYVQCDLARKIHKAPDPKKWPGPLIAPLSAHGGWFVPRGDLSRLARGGERLGQLLTTDQFVAQSFTAPPVADPWSRSDMRANGWFDLFNCVQIVLPRDAFLAAGYYRMTGVLVREPEVTPLAAVGSDLTQSCVRNGNVYFYLWAATPIVKPRAFEQPLDTDAQFIVLRWRGGQDSGTLSYWISPTPVRTTEAPGYDGQVVFTVSPGLYRRLRDKLRQEGCSGDHNLIEMSELGDGRFRNCAGDTEIACDLYFDLQSIYLGETRNNPKRRQVEAERTIEASLKQCSRPRLDVPDDRRRPMIWTRTR